MEFALVKFQFVVLFISSDKGSEYIERLIEKAVCDGRWFVNEGK